MVDLPGRGGKVPVQPDYLVSLDEQRAVLRTHSGDIVEYENPPGDS
jgi:lysine 2,3-aminomutase